MQKQSKNWPGVQYPLKSYFEENIPTNDFPWKNNQIYIIFT